MIKEIEAYQHNDFVAFEISGKLEKEDYLEILHPMIDKAAKENKKIKVFLHFGKNFEGFTTAAAWEDFKLGIHHWNSFEKIAIVTDIKWLTNSISFFSTLMPAEVRTFSNNQMEEASVWIQS